MAQAAAVSLNDRQFPTRPFVGASVAVFRNDKVLLARRAGGAGAGLLSLPGGLIELGERAEDAALRELQEEVEVKAEIVALAGHVNVLDIFESRVRHHYVVLCFAARWLEGEGQISREASEIIWADYNNLGGLHLSKGLPEILRKAHALLDPAP